MGLASAVIILIVGLPTMLGNANPTLWSILYTIFSIIVGAIFFGSFTVIMSTRLKSSEGFTVISNGIFLFFAFASLYILSCTRCNRTSKNSLLHQSSNIHSGYYKSRNIFSDNKFHKYRSCCYFCAIINSFFYRCCFHVKSQSIIFYYHIQMMLFFIIYHI